MTHRDNTPTPHEDDPLRSHQDESTRTASRPDSLRDAGPIGDVRWCLSIAADGEGPPNLEPCPFCGARLESEKDGATMEHPRNGCVIEDAYVETRSDVELWNSRVVNGPM